MAPATVLVLLITLLIFMMYSYWDLSKKRDEAKAVEVTFSALAEADMAARRLQLLLHSVQQTGLVVPEEMVLVTDLYERLEAAVNRVRPFGPLKKSAQLEELSALAEDLDPSNNPEEDKIAKLFSRFRDLLSQLSATTQQHRNKLRTVHEQDTGRLVERTAAVSMFVLSAAIALGLLLSIYFSRRLLSRIQLLSINAVRIADGKLELPEAPDRIRDELDTLTVSINRMTKRLIRVIGTEKLLEGAEEERRRIAMDLHDQTLADLSAILRGLHKLSANPSEHADIHAANLANDLERAVTNLREIMNNLHPQTLDILGLGAAIEAHLEQHYDNGDLPEYHLYLDPDVDELSLDRTHQLNIYRIAVEAIQNVIKHASATRYEISMDLRENILVLSVEDNGKGINSKNHHNGRGLNNIRERARAIGADVDWKASRFSSGTRFELRLPCS